MSDAASILFREFQGALKPHPRLSGSAWADAFRRVPAGSSPEPGPWSTERVPYLREPLDFATDREHEKVVLMFSSQVGKTELLLNAFGFFATQEPSPQLVLQPTLAAAEAFSRERLEPTIRATPALAGIIETGERKRGAKMLRKDYPGGYVALVGTNSPAGLASRPIRILLADEVDRYVDTREGDPLRLALQRTANFHNRKAVLVSTPTVAGASSIEAWFQRGDQREFRVACPSCGAMQALEWRQVRWDRDEAGNALPSSARVECRHCGARMRGSGRPPPSLLAGGVWTPVAEPTEPGVVSYRLNALYSPWVELSSLVAEFVNAVNRRDRDGLREFVNLKLGEPWDESASRSADWEVIAGRLEGYGPMELPDRALVLTAGVDVQRDRLECTVFAWGSGKESWAVEHRVVWGSPDMAGTWAGLSMFLAQERRRKDGARLAVSCTFVDSGDGTTTAEVYRYCKAHEAERVFACKGRGGPGVPVVTSPTRRNAEGAYLFNVGTDAAKLTLTSRLNLREPGPGFVHFPGEPDLGFGPEYFRQLTAEVLERKRMGNVWKAVWQKVRERNEALDCAVYALAAQELLHPDYQALAELITPERQSAAMEQPARRIRPPSKGVQL